MSERDGTKTLIGKCRCGHTGDAPDSEHADTPLEKGHGQCLVCDCERFFWVGWVGASKEDKK